MLPMNGEKSDLSDSLKSYLERKRRYFIFLFFSSLLMIFPASLLSIWIGSSGLLPLNSWSMSQPVFELRLYRTLTAIFAAVSLSLNGLILQTVLVNPIVDSSILGISSGAMLGMLLGYYLSIRTGIYLAPLASFTVSILVTAVVYFLSRIGGFRVLVIALSGIMISTMLTSLSYLILIVNPTISRGGVAVVLGSLQFSNANTVAYSLLSSAVVLFYLLARVGSLRKMMLGEELAKSVGIDTESLRKESIIASSISITLVTLAVGPIGFIGLIVPHISRILVGGDPGASAAISSALAPTILLSADVASRVAFMPSEIPVGIIMSMLGAPFFLFLLIKSARG